MLFPQTYDQLKKSVEQFTAAYIDNLYSWPQGNTTLSKKYVGHISLYAKFNSILIVTIHIPSDAELLITKMKVIAMAEVYLYCRTPGGFMFESIATLTIPQWVIRIESIPPWRSIKP